MNNLLRDYIEKLEKINTVEEYDEFIIKLHQMFYSFLEAFKEVKPDKRASLTTEALQKIQIEDSGVGTVRSDIIIRSLNTIIEAKCTRTSTNLKS